jgi:hypothetical protein
MAVDRLVDYQRAVRVRKTSSPSHSSPMIRRCNCGRSAVSRQSDVGAKVRVQSLISTEARKKTRVAIGSNRENDGIACRGVGHTARGREMPRELHLTDVRLLYLISPRVLKGRRFPCFLVCGGVVWCVFDPQEIICKKAYLDVRSWIGKKSIGRFE